MKKLFLFFSLMLVTIPAMGASLLGSGISTTTTACTTVWASVTTSNDYWSMGPDANAQKIKVSSSINICEVSFELYDDGGGTGVICHLEVWDGVDITAATQIGGDSGSVTVTATSAGTTYQFAWTSAPSISADAFVHLIVDDDGGGNLRIRTNTDANSYEDTDYDWWMQTVSDRGQDARMTIKTN